MFMELCELMGNVSDLVVVVNRIDLRYKVPRGMSVNTQNLNKLFMRALDTLGYLMKGSL